MMRKFLITLLLGMVLPVLILVPYSKAGGAQEEPKTTFSERKAYSSETSARSYFEEKSEEEFIYRRLPGLSDPSMICHNDDWNNDLEFRWCLQEAMGDLFDTHIKEVAKLEE
ncbi:MAG: hypothetical protein HY313_12045 [Acidobacteria bacterium]|nr:hypothetical protein [Acidobacteriota bacterium]